MCLHVCTPVPSCSVSLYVYMPAYVMYVSILNYITTNMFIYLYLLLNYEDIYMHCVSSMITISIFIAGGHLDVCQLLARDYADVNACDNRGVSCLMAAFRKGNVKVVKWLVKHVSQFPPDSDCKRFMQTISDKVSYLRSYAFKI